MRGPVGAVRGGWSGEGQKVEPETGFWGFTPEPDQYLICNSDEQVAINLWLMVKNRGEVAAIPTTRGELCGERKVVVANSMSSGGRSERPC